MTEYLLTLMKTRLHVKYNYMNIFIIEHGNASLSIAAVDIVLLQKILSAHQLD